MKRYTIFALVIVSLVAFANTAFAQDSSKPGISLDFKDAGRADILEGLAHGAGIEIEFDDTLEGTYTGKLTNVTLAEAFEKILPAGYEASNENFVIHVRKSGTRAAQPQTTPAAARQMPTQATSATADGNLSGAEAQASPSARDPFYQQRINYGSLLGEPLLQGYSYGAGAQAGFQNYGSYGYGYMGQKTFEALDQEWANKITDARHTAIVKFVGGKYLNQVTMEYAVGDTWVTPSQPKGASNWYENPYIVTIDDDGLLKVRYTNASGSSVERTEKLVSVAQARSVGLRNYETKVFVSSDLFTSR